MKLTMIAGSIVAVLSFSTSVFAKEYSCAVGTVEGEEFKPIKTMTIDAANTESSDFAWIVEEKLLSACFSSQETAEDGTTKNSLVCALAVPKDDATINPSQALNFEKDFDVVSLAQTADGSENLVSFAKVEGVTAAFVCQ